MTAEMASWITVVILILIFICIFMGIETCLMVAGIFLISGIVLCALLFFWHYIIGLPMSGGE